MIAGRTHLAMARLRTPAVCARAAQLEVGRGIWRFLRGQRAPCRLHRLGAACISGRIVVHC